ncbi:waprin-Phi1-like [Lacerta agilis]|uniref:waprin-Phi1-like n=1 Tax=Lacerta agilis TaxID=80427 RepID=UPI0014193170|nr:waprin-Phi1-like [Lacerta agilis]
MKPRNSSCLHLFILVSLVGFLTASILRIEVLKQNITVAAVKGGTCPDTEMESNSSNCTEECQSDASCEGVEKCCRTGCGASCHVPNDKPGTCPSLSIGISMLGACHNACEVDSNCPGDKKCCQNGCGKLACSTPEF